VLLNRQLGQLVSADEKRKKLSVRLVYGDRGFSAKTTRWRPKFRFAVVVV